MHSENEENTKYIILIVKLTFRSENLIDVRKVSDRLCNLSSDHMLAFAYILQYM